MNAEFSYTQYLKQISNLIKLVIAFYFKYSDWEEPRLVFAGVMPLVYAIFLTQFLLIARERNALLQFGGITVIQLIFFPYGFLFKDFLF